MRLSFIYSRRNLILAGLAMSTCLSAVAAPKVSLTSPYFIPDQGWVVQGNTSFAVSASDSDGISKVEFYVDDQLVSTDNSYPYSWIWSTANSKIGHHTLKAVAFNQRGLTAGLQQAVTLETAAVNNNPTQQNLSKAAATAARQLALRDVSMVRGGDSAWYLTGVNNTRSAGQHNEGINLWRSDDLQTWTYLGLVWSFENDGTNIEKTWNQTQGKPTRGVQSPKISFRDGTYYLSWNLIENTQQKTKHIKSLTGSAQGPYVAVDANDSDAQKNIAADTALVMAAAAAPSQCNWWGNVFPVCTSTLSGWGWENEQSCVANNDCSSLPSPYGLINSVERCNWYGNYFPLCTNTQSGWGWENEQSCVARTDCSTQPSPWGIEGSTNSSSKSSSSVSSSSKSSSSIKSSSSVRTSSSSSRANTNPDPTGPLTGNLGTHDPSRIIESNGKYFFYSTGRGVPMKYSTDKLKWTAGPSVFPNGFPSWTRQSVPGNDGYDAWAPDIFYMNGQYHLYYSVSKWGGDRSAIGLVTTPTLDPSAANYKWTDRGAVVADGPSDTYSAIDPAPFFDKDGNPWLVWGSGYTVSWSTPTLMLIQLDKNTGKRISANSPMYSLAPGHIEAAYIHYHNGYYYLFYNDGGCCSGTSSTYKIHMLRSTSVTGPYLDKSGVKNGSNNLFMQSSTGLYGPGHIGIISQNGHDYFTYHYYNSGGSPVLGQGRLIWGSNGWPTPGK